MIHAKEPQLRILATTQGIGWPGFLPFPPPTRSLCCPSSLASDPVSQSGVSGFLTPLSGIFQGVTHTCSYHSQCGDRRSSRPHILALGNPLHRRKWPRLLRLAVSTHHSRVVFQLEKTCQGGERTGSTCPPSPCRPGCSLLVTHSPGE